jgi:predicted O-methyltransferase YrrM
MSSTTLLHMLSKSIRNPRRAALRLVLNARVARSSLKQDRARLLRAISRAWNVDAWDLLEEYRNSDFARWYQKRLVKLRTISAGSRMGTSSDFTCEALYVLVRAAKPQVVAETGVLYGASSGHILAALAANGEGRLYSIDLGVKPGEPPHDFLVRPEFLRHWEYIVGDVELELPRLLTRLGGIDMFHHDSLHTFEHMTWEYETAAPHLRPGGILASHDVFVADSLRGIFRENAFPAFCQQRQLKHIMIRNSGIARRPKRTPYPSRPGSAPRMTLLEPIAASR